VTLKFRNNSKSEIDFSGAWSDLRRVNPNWEFNVRDSAGEPVPRRHDKYEELAGGSYRAGSVGPGKSQVEEVDLARLYDFSKPGKYVVQVSRKIPKELGGGTIESNKITLTLTEDGKQD